MTSSSIRRTLPAVLRRDLRRRAGTEADAVLPRMLIGSREQRRIAQGATTVVTSNELFNRVLCRSMADLGMLMTRNRAGPLSYAGIPGIRRRSAATNHYGDADAVVRSRSGTGRVAAARRLSGQDWIRLDDAEPGKILHEMRAGEMAALREVPFGLYYGSVDSTPLFVMLAGLYFERTGDEETLRELWPNIEAALAWIDGPATGTAMDLSNISGRPSRALPTRAGRIRTTPFSTPTGNRRRGRSHLPRCRAMCSAAKQTIARAARRLGYASMADALDAQALQLANASTKPFGARRSAATRSRLTAASNNVASARQTPDRCCCPALRPSDALPLSPNVCCGGHFSRAGGFARSRARRVATIRCRITTVRSGRTTMR